MTATRSAPHPRVGDRRAEVRRARSRRRLRILVAVLAVFTVLGTAWLALQSSLLDVDSVEVRGAARTGRETVAEAAAVAAGEPLLLLDRGAVADRVERLPWVLEAHVSSSLPGTLKVRVEERSPAAWVAGGPGRYVLLDGTGRVLGVRRQAPVAFPEIQDVGFPPEPGEVFDDAADEIATVSGLPPGLRERVTAIAQSEDGLHVEVSGVEQVLFGSSEDLEAKWSALEAVLREVGEEPVYQIDLRVPTTPAVRRSPPPRTPR